MKVPIEDLRVLSVILCRMFLWFSSSVYTAKNQYRNWKQIFPEKELRGHSPNFHIRCVCERFIYSHDGSAYSAAGNMWTDPGIIYIAHRHMNVETGT
jgi:hypothetical protein